MARLCVPLRRYQGSKSDVIRNMINDKLKERINVKERCKEKDLIYAKRIYDSAHKSYLLSKEKLDKIENKLKIIWSDSNKKWELTYDCIVPSWVTKKLQRAQDLSALGQRRQAKKIWDDLIEKYDLPTE